MMEKSPEQLKHVIQQTSIAAFTIKKKDPQVLKEIAPMERILKNFGDFTIRMLDVLFAENPADAMMTERILMKIWTKMKFNVFAKQIIVTKNVKLQCAKP